MKCIHCYREISDDIKFCNYCGTMQPLDREAYAKEHPELANAISEDELNQMIESKSSGGDQQQSTWLDVTESLEQPPAYNPQDLQQETQGNSATIPAADTATQQQQEEELLTPEIDESAGDTFSQPVAALMQCPDCGAMIAADSAYCEHCGCRFVDPSQQLPQEVYAPETQRAVHNENYPYNHRNGHMDYDQDEYIPRKRGMSGATKAMVTLSVILLLGALGFAAYYFLFSNKVSNLSVNEETVVFRKSGGEKTVKVSTDAEKFEITNKPDWVKVNVSGKDLIISCDPAEGIYEDREGIIEVTAGDKIAKISVKQTTMASYISVYPSSLRDVTREAQELEIEIETDGDPTQFEYDIKDKDGNNIYWIEIINKTSNGITLSFDPNDTYSSKEAVIIITSGRTSQTIRVVQKGECYTCDGTGKVDCETCNGTGRIERMEYDDYEETLRRINEDCDDCDGGKVTCRSCNGTGNSD